MDVNSLLSQTITTLSQPQHLNSFHAGEIAMVGPKDTSESKGGTEASGDDIDKMLSTLEKAAKSVDQRVSFVYNEKTQRLIMKVTDPATNEVVRQIPSREVVHILENIHDMVGMFIDEQR